MKNQLPLYKIQIFADGNWRTLQLQDFPTILRDSEAKAIVAQFSRDTGLEYRAQVRCGRRFITLEKE